MTRRKSRWSFTNVILAISIGLLIFLIKNLGELLHDVQTKNFDWSFWFLFAVGGALLVALIAAFESRKR